MVGPSADIREGRHLCHSCHKHTTWSGTKKQVCGGCGKVFPCLSTKCGHTDCEEHRIYYAAQEPVVAPVDAPNFDDPMFG